MLGSPVCQEDSAWMRDCSGTLGAAGMVFGFHMLVRGEGTVLNLVSLTCGCR